ncbi:hypothetical protein KI387_038145, partial [Taxus chinensis]
EALNIIGQKLGKTDWNFTADPCLRGYLGLDCDCSDLSNTICHVINITLVSLNLSGTIPPELGNLSRLENLTLADNYLTGPIPPQLGSLNSLKFLSLSRNLLSGPIPKELGSLSLLEELRIHSNNLSGALPPEIGNLKMLQKLHLSSNRFIGPIPETYFNLQNLAEFWASSNDFTGKISSNIGNMTGLKKLILQGTSLEGPIPSNISKLIRLEDLRISDIAQGGNSLEFILTLKNLKTLVLRNNNITGNIPAEIGGSLSKLETLDLSFNNLTGGIPESLKSITSLEFLFLGNNNLEMELPSWLASARAKIDLSYNKLSGRALPSERTNVNLIWNSLSSTDHRSLAGCLQSTFPCGKKTPNYGLAINCGGKKRKISASKIIFDEFDEDDAVLVDPPFFRSSRENWGVTNIGYFMDADNTPDNPFIAMNDTAFVIAPHNNTVVTSNFDPELYRTARISPTSLRYYGLGLQNGSYTIELHFAEIQFPAKTAKGRRIFDVYIQGDKVLKDFDIMEAAGEKNLVVVMNYTINITQTFLEIHFFWAGKGTCCEPQDVYGPLVSAIIVTPNFKPHVPKKSKTIKIVIIVAVVIVVLGLLLILSLVYTKKRKRGFNLLSCFNAGKDDALTTMEGNSFSLRTLKVATRNFDPKNKIGEGGFGAVYKGVLPDGRQVAIKQLSSQSKQGNHEFLNEVGTISAVQHPDVVKLYGCCVEGEDLLLVYEYMENGNLAHALFGHNEPRVKLDWTTRYSICLGVARGLAYLHEESLLKIVHRDIKSTNILLDKDLKPKVADFGLARLFDDGNTHVSTRVAGTIGYMAPEYAFRGHLTDKADVYSFGVVILEIVSGRTHTDTSLEEDQAYLLEWAWHLYEEKQMPKLVDANLLHSGYNEEEVVRIVYIGLLCTNENPGRSPSMSAIVEMLEGRMKTPAPESRPGYLNHWQTWQLAA